MSHRRWFLLGVAFYFGSFAHAAQPQDELASIREQLEQLTRRVDRLEQENAALKARNEALQRLDRASVSESNDAAPTEVPDWVSGLSLKGDVRYRHQHTDDQRAASDRDEHLLRARMNLEAKIVDTLVLGIGLSTSDNGNPRGANVRLDDAFARKGLDLDLGYIDWTFAPGAHAIGGKMRMPFARPGQSLFWDNDVNPEGIALTYRTASWFGSAYGFWIDENVASGSAPNASGTSDTQMFGVQIGHRLVLGEDALVIAGMYYDLAAAQGRRPFFNGSNGNSLDLLGGLAYDFQVAELMVEFSTSFGEWPLQIWADVAHNLDAELDTAYAVGALFGKASGAGTWEAGLAYQLIEKDALFAQFIDSDFGGGLSDSRGWILRAGWAPQDNVVLNATYFLNEGNVERGNTFDYERLLLDVGVRF